MSLPSGRRLAQYEILEPIGSGGMGEVYRAHDARLGRDVAIKVMSEHVATDPDMRRRFETEARAVAALSHPCILSIHELAVIDGLPMAVMELLQGENLRSRIRRGPLPWQEAVRIGASIAEGLNAAHVRGIVHRDLKPENVFLTSDRGVKILDFGLALQRLESPLSPEGPTMAVTGDQVVMGTFGYMSPEQVTGGRVDARSDIFSLGCVIFEMLTGRPLFTGDTPREVLARLMQDSGPQLSLMDPLLPSQLRPILLRCLERDPARRFESAHDVAIALMAVQSSTSVSPVRRRARGKSLAVLPFVNASNDPGIQYLIDGITESIINSLSQLGGLRVVPRSVAFRYKGLQADPSTVGLALNVRTILTGRVVQQGPQINIQAELVDTGTESQLWGDQFQYDMSDVVAVQQEIAWRISEALRLKLTGEQKRKLRRKPTVDPAAYQEYLRGRFHWNNWTPDSFRRALDHFERAIALDSGYAPAYAGLADTLGALAYYGAIEPQEGFPRAKAAATRAIELDPQAADAHASLGLAHLFWDRDWDAAERSFTRAIALNPELALPHALYAIFLITVGRHDESIEEARTAQRLDPLSLLISMTVCWTLHFAGRHEEAITEALKTRELAPGFPEAANILLSSYEDLGRFEQGARLCSEEPCFGVKADGPVLLEALREGGKEAYWRKRLDLLAGAAPHQKTGMIEYGYAVVYAHLGEKALALDRLERLAASKAGGAVFMAVDPCLRLLRDEPRFKALLRQVGVPTASAPHTVST
jgi:serine/threonine protein kinase/tetratricopeptide (TPR) repeat protein